MKGLFAWVGYKQIAVRYDRAARPVGSSKWNYWKLWNFALEGLTSFTTVPLRLATYIGLSLAALSALYGSFIIVRTLIVGSDVAGYPSLVVVMLFIGGTQLVFLGVLGEYVGRIFTEVKQRPLYLIDCVFPESFHNSEGLNSSDPIHSRFPSQSHSGEASDTVHLKERQFHPTSSEKH